MNWVTEKKTGFIFLDRLLANLLVNLGILKFVLDVVLFLWLKLLFSLFWRNPDTCSSSQSSVTVTSTHYYQPKKCTAPRQTTASAWRWFNANNLQDITHSLGDFFTCFIINLTVILNYTQLQQSRSVLPVVLCFNKPHKSQIYCLLWVI